VNKSKRTLLSYFARKMNLFSEAQNSAKGFALHSAEPRLASLLITLAKRTEIHEVEHR